MVVRYWCLLAITSFGLFLRLLHIDQWPLWSDEALTLMLAQIPLATLFLAPVDPTPGLYYALHQLLLGPSVGVAAARSISVVAGVLLIPASYFLARKANAPALMTAALVALSFPLIDYSQEARAYSLLVLFVTLSAGFFLWWTRSGRRSLLVVSLAIGMLAFYTHFVAVFWLGPLALATIWTARRRAVPLLLAMAIVAVPEIWRVSHYNDQSFFWLVQANARQAGDTLAHAVFPFQPTGIAALALMLLLTWRLWVHRSSIAEWARTSPPAAAVVLVFLTLPLTIWLFGLAITPVFMTRTILISLPGFMLALALLSSFERRSVRIGVIGLYAASLMVTGTMRPREDWRALAQRTGTDTMLMCQSRQGPAMMHVIGHNSRLLLRYGDSVLKVDERPWQRAYLYALMNGDALRRATERGQRIARNAYPVWAIKSGFPDTFATRPTTLDQAIRDCKEFGRNYVQRYQAD